MRIHASCCTRTSWFVPHIVFLAIISFVQLSLGAEFFFFRYPHALQTYLESLSKRGESLAVQEELPTVARYPQALQDLLSGKNVKVNPARRRQASRGVKPEETFVAR